MEDGFRRRGWGDVIPLISRARDPGIVLMLDMGSIGLFECVGSPYQLLPWLGYECVLAYPCVDASVDRVYSEVYLKKRSTGQRMIPALRICHLKLGCVWKGTRVRRVAEGCPSRVLFISVKHTHIQHTSTAADRETHLLKAG